MLWGPAPLQHTQQLPAGPDFAVVVAALHKAPAAHPGSRRSVVRHTVGADLVVSVPGVLAVLDRVQHSFRFGNGANRRKVRLQPPVARVRRRAATCVEALSFSKTCQQVGLKIAGGGREPCVRQQHMWQCEQHMCEAACVRHQHMWQCEQHMCEAACVRHQHMWQCEQHMSRGWP